jgi:hypothetical protein
MATYQYSMSEDINDEVVEFTPGERHRGWPYHLPEIRKGLEEDGAALLRKHTSSIGKDEMESELRATEVMIRVLETNLETTELRQKNLERKKAAKKSELEVALKTNQSLKTNWKQPYQDKRTQKRKETVRSYNCKLLKVR